jgi:hypothetical protein
MELEVGQGGRMSRIVETIWRSVWWCGVDEENVYI